MRLTALWVAGLLLPLGYWSSRTAGGDAGATGVESVGAWGRTATVGLLVATVGIGLGIVPGVLGYPPTDSELWLAAVVGLAAGWCVGHLSRRGRRAPSLGASRQAPRRDALPRV